MGWKGNWFSWLSHELPGLGPEIEFWWRRIFICGEQSLDHLAASVIPFTFPSSVESLR